MRKLTAVLFSVLFIFCLVSCPDGDKKKDDNIIIPIVDTKVIDTALIGFWGKVVRSGSGSSCTYYPTQDDIYKFTSTDFQKNNFNNFYNNNSTFTPQTTVKAYTKDGKLYKASDDSLIFIYTLNAYPENLDKDITDTNSTKPIMTSLKTDALANKVIFITLAGTSEKLIFVKNNGAVYYNNLIK